MAVSLSIHWANIVFFQFWMYCREDLRKLKRITLLWDYIRQTAELNRALLLGETSTMLFAD